MTDQRPLQTIFNRLCMACSVAHLTGLYGVSDRAALRVKYMFATRLQMDTAAESVREWRFQPRTNQQRLQNRPDAANACSKTYLYCSNSDLGRNVSRVYFVVLVLLPR